MCPCWLPHRAGCKPAPLALPCFQADFGLSKTLPINKHAEYGYLDSKFRLTGETGGWALGGTKRGSGKETLGAVQSLAGSIYPNNASVHCLAKS